MTFYVILRMIGRTTHSCNRATCLEKHPSSTLQTQKTKTLARTPVLWTPSSSSSSKQNLSRLPLGKLDLNFLKTSGLVDETLVAVQLLRFVAILNNLALLLSLFIFWVQAETMSGYSLACLLNEIHKPMLCLNRNINKKQTHKQH